MTKKKTNYSGASNIVTRRIIRESLDQNIRTAASRNENAYLTVISKEIQNFTKWFFNALYTSFFLPFKTMPRTLGRLVTTAEVRSLMAYRVNVKHENPVMIAQEMNCDPRTIVKWAKREKELTTRREKSGRVVAEAAVRKY